jgi:hypothetical protein
VVEVTPARAVEVLARERLRHDSDLYLSVDSVGRLVAEFDDLTRQIQVQGERIQSLLGDVEVARLGARSADNALRAWKTRVREAAIEVQRGHSGHISMGDLNEWLTGLGLDPVERNFQVTLDVNKKVRVTVDVTAVDDDAAEAAAKVRQEDGDVDLSEGEVVEETVTVYAVEEAQD